MKIFKIAQFGGGTKLVLIINKETGAIKTEIVGHEGASTCANSSEEDQALLNDLMNSEVEGFGSLGETTDAGENNLALEEILRKTPKTPATPLSEPSQEDKKGKKKQKRLDVGGMGV